MSDLGKRGKYREVDEEPSKTKVRVKDQESRKVEKVDTDRKNGDARESKSSKHGKSRDEKKSKKRDYSEPEEPEEAEPEEGDEEDDL